MAGRQHDMFDPIGTSIPLHFSTVPDSLLASNWPLRVHSNYHYYISGHYILASVL